MVGSRRPQYDVGRWLIERLIGLELASGEAGIISLRTLVAIIVAPLLPIYLLILSTGQVLPVVRFVDTYPTALAIGGPLYLLLRFSRKTRLWHFILFSFFAFGFLTFASTALSYQQLTFAASGGIDRVLDGELTIAGWVRCVHVGTVVGIYAAVGGITVWTFAHWHVFNRVREHLAVALPVLMVFVAANVLAFQAIDWSGYEPPDLGCHSAGSGGPMRRPSIYLQISEAEWPELRAIFERVATDFGLSYRDTSETRPGVVNLLYLSMCRDNGLQVTVNEQRWVRPPEVDVPGSDQGVYVFVRAADDNQEWRTVTEELLEGFDRLWGEDVRFRDGSGYFVPRPVDLFVEE